jgi:hydroxyethylthiazole kinase-like uncharacterized protein yjeF
VAQERKAGMKAVTPEQMNEIDKCAINEYGIPGILLMENASIAVTLEAIDMMGGCKGKVVTVVSGRGNNGGDGFAAARLLHSRGVHVRAYLLGSFDGISGDALVNMTILNRIGIPIVELKSDKDIDMMACDMNQSQLIIDGIFGTGLNKEVTGIAGAVIDRMNTSGKAILSIDIPSGVDGKSGRIMGTCIKADRTVSFCMPKTGLLLNPGCEYAGRLVVADIGIPACAIKKQNISTELIDGEIVSGLLPSRRSDSNKGDYGRALIISGSTGMTGSGCLAAMAALRCGAGLVYAGVPGSLADIYGACMTEPIILPLEDGGAGVLTEECSGQILAAIEKMDVAAIGPGLTSSAAIGQVVEQVIKNSRLPLIIDADALNAISKNTSVLKKLKAWGVITPHPGEMARLTGLSVAEIQKDRLGIARSFAQEYGVATVLKGSRTVVALPDGRIYINPTGNAGMATAGTGDVLTGIITGLAAQGVPVYDAAVAGVYLHGLAGDRAADLVGMHGMVASDILPHISHVMSQLS